MGNDWEGKGATREREDREGRVMCGRRVRENEMSWKIKGVR